MVVPSHLTPQQMDVVLCNSPLSVIVGLLTGYAEICRILRDMLRGSLHLLMVWMQLEALSLNFGYNSEFLVRLYIIKEKWSLSTSCHVTQFQKDYVNKQNKN